LYSDEKAEQNISIDILVDFHNLLNQLFAIADEKLFLEVCTVFLGVLFLVNVWERN
jgi:hypothetical protein